MIEFGKISALLLVVFLAFLGNSDAKRDYEVEWEGVDFDRNPNLLVRILNLRIGKFNQTAYVLNFLANFTVDAPRDTIVTVTAYEKMASNKYSKIPMKLLTGNFCEIVEHDPFVYRQVLANSNLPSKCPMYKGQYWVKDWVPDMSAFPDKLPGGDRFRVDAVYSSKGKAQFTMSAFIYINRHV